MNSQIDHQRYLPEQFEGGKKIVYAHDLGGNFTFLNQVGEQISGYSCEEMCRMNIAELVPVEIAAHVREQIVRNVTRRVGTVYEIDLIAKDGRRVPLEVSTALVLRNGEPVEIQGIAVPSVIRSASRNDGKPRCLDKEFFVT
jgi:PAS domain S-box-containing protein